MMIRFKSLLAAAILLAAAPCGWTQDTLVVADFSQGLDATGAPKQWHLKEKAGRADLALVKADGLNAVMLRSVNSSFAIQRKVRAQLQDHPILSWKWKVTKLPEGGDFRRAKTDDQAAQLFVAFSKTKAIVYLWDSTAPPNLMADALAPPFMSIKVVVVRSGAADTGRWITETRNVLEDYKRFYGPSDKNPVVSGMRLQINTQHTKSSAESYFADVMFRSETALP